MTLSSTSRVAVASRMSARLRQLVRQLAHFEDALALGELEAIVAASGIQRADAAPYLSLQTDSYCHRDVYRSSHLEIGCIGWRPGQHTPVHHHAGSACCVLVLDGVLTNAEFPNSEQSLAVQKRTLHAGDILAYRGHELHRMSNDTLEANLFTLHVYSPPLAPLSHRVTGAEWSLNRRKS
jgi:predicted metal-dependent enzyme (double-stranded beta helix superfamily)